MSLDTIRAYMEQRFSKSELQHFLGESLFSQLIEWFPDENLYSQQILSQMILAVYGSKILEDKAFRVRLFKSFTNKEISIFDKYLPESIISKGLKEKSEYLGNVKWEQNGITMELLKILELDVSTIFMQRLALSPQEKVSAYDKFYELLDYQFAIKKKVLAYINSGNDLPKLIIRMPTGTGKTKTTMHTLINQFVFHNKKKGLVVWIAHTKELLMQAVNTFKNVWAHIGIGETQLYKAWDSYNLPEGEDVNGFLFCSIQKLYGVCKNNKSAFHIIQKNAILIVVDEAHRSAATETRKVINELMSIPEGSQDRALIGLTATPGRTSGQTIESESFANMYERKIITIEPSMLNLMNSSGITAASQFQDEDIITYFQNRKVLAKIRREKLEYGDLTDQERAVLKSKMTANGYSDVTAAFLQKIAFNSKRNKVVVDRLRQLHEEKIPTIVFACSVEHGKMLSAALTLQGIPNGHVFGDMNTIERDTIISRFKNEDDPIKILINYEVLTTGFDSPNIKCVFITRPTQSTVLYSQMLGRGLRGPMMNGSAECLLIDIEDNLNKYLSESAAFNSFEKYWR